MVIRLHRSGLIALAAALAGVVAGWLAFSGRVPWPVLSGTEAAADPKNLLIERVRWEWGTVPANLPLAERMQVLAQHATDLHHVELADADGDGLPDLILSLPVWETRTPLAVFRAADLAVGRFQPHVLAPWLNARLAPGNVVAVKDLNRDGQVEVAVAYGPGSGSGAIMQWFIYGWYGHSFRMLFGTMVDNWRGPNWLTLSPGRITLSCRPMGTYDHKHAPHRQQQEVWTWQVDRYQLTEHRTPPAPTERQQINDAEVSFRRQEYAQALPLYRRALTLPLEPKDGAAWQPYIDQDWRPYIHLRLGQTLALLGHYAQARAELEQAVPAGGFAGLAAAAFLKEYTGPGQVVRAFTTLLNSGGDSGTAPAPWSAVAQDLAPPEVALQAYVSSGNAISADGLAAAGFPVAAIRVADLDGNGQAEVWVRLQTGDDPRRDLLAVRTKAGWRVGETHTEHALVPDLGKAGGGRQTLLFRVDQGPAKTPEYLTLAWDGSEIERTSAFAGNIQRQRRPLLPDPFQCRQEAE